MLAPAFMSALLLICAWIFPVTEKEFRMVQKDIARRKGLEAEEVTEKEKAALEKVTGFSYDKLWNPENAGVKK